MRYQNIINQQQLRSLYDGGTDAGDGVPGQEHRRRRFRAGDGAPQHRRGRRSDVRGHEGHGEVHEEHHPVRARAEILPVRHERLAVRLVQRRTGGRDGREGERAGRQFHRGGPLHGIRDRRGRRRGEIAGLGRAHHERDADRHAAGPRQLRLDG